MPASHDVRIRVNAGNHWISSRLTTRGWDIQALRALLLRRNYGRIPVLHSKRLAFAKVESEMEIDGG